MGCGRLNERRSPALGAELSVCTGIFGAVPVHLPVSKGEPVTVSLERLSQLSLSACVRVRGVWGVSTSAEQEVCESMRESTEHSSSVAAVFSQNSLCTVPLSLCLIEGMYIVALPCTRLCT